MLGTQHGQTRNPDIGVLAPNVLPPSSDTAINNCACSCLYIFLGLGGALRSESGIVRSRISMSLRISAGEIGLPMRTNSRFRPSIQTAYTLPFGLVAIVAKA